MLLESGRVIYLELIRNEQKTRTMRDAAKKLYTRQKCSEN